MSSNNNNNSVDEMTTTSGASSPERNTESNIFSRLPPSPTGTKSGVKRISFATDLVDVMEDDSLVEEEEEEKTRHWSTSLFRGSKRDSEDLAEEIANVKRGGGGGNSNSNSNKTLGSKNNGGGGIINVDNSFSSEDIDVSKMFENEDTENSGGTDTAGGNFEDEDYEEEEYWFHGISVSTQ